MGVGTLLDASVRDEEWVFVSAGTARPSILMMRADLERISGASVAAFTQPVAVELREGS